MRAGFRTADITPAIGMEAPGDYVKSHIQRIHDPLNVRAAVFEDAATALVVVGLDALSLPTTGWLTRRARREIEERTGIPGDHVLLAASHTHSGGPLGGFLPSEVADAPEPVRTLLLEHSIMADPSYAECVAGQIAAAVCEAWRDRREVCLSFGTGRAEGVAYNRRFRMANGRAFTHPGKGNPDIVEPAGPVDPAVGAICVWTPDGELLGCVVNFSCHCTTFSGGVSADYVYHIERVLQGVHGPGATVVFANGACGDVTQVDNQSLRAREFGEHASRVVGTAVGAEVLKVLASAPQGDGGPLAAASMLLTIDRRRPSRERVATARRIVESGLASGERDTEWIFAKEVLITDYLTTQQPQAGVEIQALQIGPAAFVANPAELFCEIGLGIKAKSPFRYTFVVELANGCVGYVPPPSAFRPGGGGYETVLTSHSNLDVEAGEQIMQTSVALLGDFTPGPEPVEPQVEPEPVAWTYGVLGPDLE